MSSPVLPPELERIIFEMAALLRPTNIPNLMRTAWRVKNCYHIDEFPQLTLQGLRQQSATKPPGFFQSAPRDYFDLAGEVEYLLNLCSAVEALAVVGKRRLELPALGADLLPHLRRLKLLDVDWRLHTEAVFAGLKSMPPLTHFAFNACPPVYHLALGAMCNELRDNTRLSHVVLLSWDPGDLRAAIVLAKDIRVHTASGLPCGLGPGRRQWPQFLGTRRGISRGTSSEAR
ncbi:hypothetical protein B0H16DRAFT_1694525 [Mycena metata]|uniref:Uncharacterized protein n=1 Tax=Mycena metata TaxID=1033252 RepID=A0AAD7IBH8_9AGAR|nr:hypothetical protein B0H16DRAFT_1694525 [Mycena metata]